MPKNIKNAYEERTSTSFRLSKKLLEKLEVMAKQENITISDLIRIYVTKGINEEIFCNNLDETIRVLSEVIDSKLEPFTNRIISLIQKNGKIQAATYFLLINRLGKDESIKGDIYDIIEDCNKLAIGYIKQPNSDVAKYFSDVPELVEKALSIGNTYFRADWHKRKIM